MAWWPCPMTRWPPQTVAFAAAVGLRGHLALMPVSRRSACCMESAGAPPCNWHNPKRLLSGCLLAAFPRREKLKQAEAIRHADICMRQERVRHWSRPPGCPSPMPHSDGGVERSIWGSSGTRLVLKLMRMHRLQHVLLLHVT